MAVLVVVDYLNARPLYEALCEVLPARSISLGSPAECARRVAEGEARAGILPVAAVIAAGNYRVVPGFAVGSDGPVGSVVIVSEQPLEDCDTVLLDAASRTSVVLARVILHARLGAERYAALRFRSRGARDIVREVSGATAGLIIGDPALEIGDRFAHALDLGAAWKDLTGLPFVFAVWAGWPDALDANDRAALAEAARRGLGRREDIARDYARRIGAAERSERYFTYLTGNLRHVLDIPAQKGLREFARRAADMGLLPPYDLRFYDDPRPRAGVPVDQILEDAAAGTRRLSVAEAERLVEQAPLFDLALAADRRRNARHPADRVTYIVDRNVNYTNVCVTACRFCAFFRAPGDPEGYVLSRDALAGKIQDVVNAGGVQILLQGGLHPELPLAWYEDLFRWIKTTFPTIALHALSPEEILHLVTLSGHSLETVLARLVAAGLDSLPGGGAEILVDRVRRSIARKKCTSAEWLEVMRVAHGLGLRSSATMMFGTTDTARDRVLHLAKIRDLQDETGGFVAFICWDFQHEQGTTVSSGETGVAVYLRTQAVARLFLDNVPSVQASWVTQGPGVGQLALAFGANDFGSVMFEENVVSSAGTTFRMNAASVESHIRAAGYRPARRNQRYEILV